MEPSPIPTMHRTHTHSPEDLLLAKRFAQGLRQNLKELVREVVFFGSSARGLATAVHESDIDVLVMVDDTSISLSNETVSAYRIITEKCAASVSGRLHINTIRLSAFFEYALNGDPLAVNIIRDGIPLLGAGLLEPLKVLLHKGGIKPTKENIMVYMLRAPQTLLGSRWHVLAATIDLYWASLDACHALLIHFGHAPDSPKETIHLIERYFVRSKALDKTHLATLTDLHALSETIIDRSRKDVSGKDYDFNLARVKSLIGRVKVLMSEQAKAAL